MARVLIAGAGIGGLAAAGCLLLAGHEVEVYEQAPELGEVGAGIQQSANATHVLRRLGVLEALEERAFRPPVTEFRLFDSGEVLQALALAATHEERHGAPYLQLHRADYHAVLAARIESLKPGCVRLGATVTGFREDIGSVTLHLAGGERVAGDVLIGADGIKSAVRRQIAGENRPRYTGDSAWRSIVPVERLPAGFLEGKSSIWVGPGKHAVVYFLRGGVLLNFVGAVELEERIEESWTQKRPWEELRADFEGWHPDILRIVDAADRESCFRWALNVHPHLPRWSTGRVALLGDAAHPMLPYAAQGAAMAVEDAAVLARALDEAGSVPGALVLYEAHRKPRARRVVEESRDNRRLFHLPDEDALRAAFAGRNMDRERSDWLYSYNPLTADLS